MKIAIVSFKGGVGKTTTALHLAAYCQQFGETILIDGDLNRSALDWADRGGLGFDVADSDDDGIALEKYDHAIIDTPARPGLEDLVILAKNCDLLVIPVSPDALSIGVTLQMIGQLQQEQISNYKILLTLVPPSGGTYNRNKAVSRRFGKRGRQFWISNVGRDAHQEFSEQQIPIFEGHIKRSSVFQQASLEGVPVSQLPGKYAQEAWEYYQWIGKELLAKN